MKSDVKDRQVLKLTIPDFVSVNHYLAYRMVRGKLITFKTKEANDLHRKILLEIDRQVKAQGWITDLNPMQHYIVDAVFYFPRIDMDCNNYYKVAFDAITDSGKVWADDNLACERVQKVMYDNKNPRIELTIYKSDFIGIFDNEDELKEFEDKCKTCTRYTKNCSLLRKAKEGRIQEEITNNDCTKYKELKGVK